MTRPLPPGLPIELDPSVRRRRGGRLLVGGRPLRAVTLTERGVQELDGLLAGRPSSEAARALAGRLVRAGLAHPRPPAGSPDDVTVVVPVRDRPAGLAACLAGIGGRPRVIVVDDGSVDPAATAAVCAQRSATLLELRPGRGPAAARNAGFAAAATPLVAFLDSDTLPPPGWVERLAGHFADPSVGAVAPRIVPYREGAAGSVAARFLQVRSPLDMGPRPGPVGHGCEIRYVPSAALLVRRAALDGCEFDPALRYGEDVDLVWRLADAGWAVRYEPAVEVAHREPASWKALLERRYRYGTSAGALCRRHPGRLAHTAVPPWALAIAGLLAIGRPRAAGAVAALQFSVASTSVARCGLPPADAGRVGARHVGRGLAGLGWTATTLAMPVVVAGLAGRRTRPVSALLLAASVVDAWLRGRPRLDPFRFALGVLADDAAYGAGVLAGCLAERTAAPLRPVGPLCSARPDRDGPIDTSER